MNMAYDLIGQRIHDMTSAYCLIIWPGPCHSPKEAAQTRINQITEYAQTGSVIDIKGIYEQPIQTYNCPPARYIGYDCEQLFYFLPGSLVRI